ncbi:MAG: SurA N-terminal domain-containing protein [Clostridia bacterium]|nr:SurA N-terminal domain-containing protein [Clostridia bacterium]
MKKSSFCIKATSLFLALFALLSLFGCNKSREVPVDSLGKTVVGTVGDHDVYYDEFYFLYNNYAPSLSKEYGEGTPEFEAAMWETISKNIISNYAILELCEDAGVEYDEKKLEDDVQKFIDNTISASFDGDRDAYLENLDENYLTDRYVRFTAKVDLLYELLPSAYAKEGLLIEDEIDLYKYYYDNFRLVKHIMIVNGEGEDKELNRANAEKARELLLSGQMTIDELIGGSPAFNSNEDLLIPADGYCIAPGTMDKTYEDAVFSLEDPFPKNISKVIEATGEDSMTGERHSAFYVIKLLPLTSQYIDKHYEDLHDDYIGSFINEKLEEKKAELTFVKSDFAENELDINDLKAPEKGTDWIIVGLIIGAAVVVIAVLTVVLIFVFKNRKKKKLLRSLLFQKGKNND